VKTKEPIKQILVNNAVSLIQKYETHMETICGERVFPARHLNNINDGLKLIQVKAGIAKTLTTHVSRHTANQMLNDIGYINGDVINYMLGWSNSKQGMRMNYKSISFEILLYAKTQFQNFIDQNFKI
jgi:integrase